MDSPTTTRRLAQWIIRIVMSMLYWPVDDAEVERRCVGALRLAGVPDAPP